MITLQVGKAERVIEILTLFAFNEKKKKKKIIIKILLISLRCEIQTNHRELLRNTCNSSKYLGLLFTLNIHIFDAGFYLT